MKGIQLELSDFQEKMLRPFFYKVRKSFEAKQPGALFAQLHQAETGNGWIDVQFIENDKAKAIQQITGVEPGSGGTGEIREVEVYVSSPK